MRVLVLYGYDHQFGNVSRFPHSLTGCILTVGMRIAGAEGVENDENGCEPKTLSNAGD